MIIRCVVEFHSWELDCLPSFLSIASFFFLWRKCSRLFCLWSVPGFVVVRAPLNDCVTVLIQRGVMSVCTSVYGSDIVSGLFKTCRVKYCTRVSFVATVIFGWPSGHPHLPTHPPTYLPVTISSGIKLTVTVIATAWYSQTNESCEWSNMTGAVKTCYSVINDPKCLFLTNNAVF